MSRSISVSRSMRASFCGERATIEGVGIALAPENKQASEP
jgi:hypothetical protein